ncbi:oligoribonuclease [Pseudoglutamicibacter cumminsii]|uniref:oligoribonuclease n=1 Tax=Pseudoglutamicibacter cumminsii TaxID=156979 RepID=UPI00195D460C|nr:oligoribonuclease [Pseudoglutamicibacter cumminsii]
MDSRSHSAVVSDQVAQPGTVASQSSPSSGQRTLSSGDMPLVWIDCEMTGLDAVNDALIEVAVIVTDSQLQPVDDGISVVIKPPAGAVEKMDNFVTQMHTNSGLLEEIDGGVSMEEAQATVLGYIQKIVPEAGIALLAGNSVGNDRLFLARDMPEVIDHLHYRIVDVSSIKELARRWYPTDFDAAPAKTGNHRALGDIQESIDELAYYRSAIMKSNDA